MQIKTLRKLFDNQAGMTLIEMVITCLIGGIVCSGLVMAYSDGIEAWNSVSGKMIMYNEGQACISMIERFIRTSFYVSTGTSIGLPSPNLTIEADYFNGRAYTTRSAEIYFLANEKMLRWNNMIWNQGFFNQPLIPAVDTHYDNPDDIPYIQVINATFTPMDIIRPQSPSEFGYALLKIEITMADAHGDTLTMTSMISKRNKSSQS